MKETLLTMFDMCLWHLRLCRRSKLEESQQMYRGCQLMYSDLLNFRKEDMPDVYSKEETKRKEGSVQDVRRVGGA